MWELNFRVPSIGYPEETVHCTNKFIRHLKKNAGRDLLVIGVTK